LHSTTIEEEIMETIHREIGCFGVGALEAILIEVEQIWAQDLQPAIANEPQDLGNLDPTIPARRFRGV
jgi:hypothetical protein